MRKDSLPLFIAGRGRADYRHGDMPRILASLLLALALLLSPVAMSAGAAHATMLEVASSAPHCAEDGLAPQQEERAPQMEIGCAAPARQYLRPRLQSVPSCRPQRPSSVQSHTSSFPEYAPREKRRLRVILQRLAPHPEFSELKNENACKCGFADDHFSRSRATR